MQRDYDVIVIGGGAHGLAALWHLGRRGVRRCALIERFEIGHAHGSSHGRTRITRSVYEDERWVRLMRIVRDEDWPRLERAAGRALIERCDGCFLGVGGELFSKYVRAVAAATTSGEVELLDVPEARRRFPQFRYDDVVGMLHDRTAGVIRAADTLAALARLARADGAELFERTRVLALERERDPIVVRTERGELRAERVIVAAGAWTAALVPELRASLRPIRQTVAHYRLGADPGAGRVGRFPLWCSLGDGENEFHYGLPELEGEGVKLARHETAGRADDPDALDFAPRAEDLAHLDSIARARLSAPSVERVSVEPCLYTIAPDDGFRIGLAPDDPRIAVASACSGHGFKFAPLVGRVLAGLALDGVSGVHEFEVERASFELES